MGKILVVDGQFDVSLLVSIFRDDGHEVKMASDGTEALQLLSSFEPDLILLEMRMPRINGIETLSKRQFASYPEDSIIPNIGPKRKKILIDVMKY